MNAKQTETVVGTCVNCFGLGHLAHFAHVCGGTCFTCTGDGLVVYAPKAWRYLPLNEWPRAERLAVIKQCIAWFEGENGMNHEEYLKRNKKAAKRFLLNTIRSHAGSLDTQVWDRAYAALNKVCPLDFVKVAKGRAVAFPAAIPLPANDVAA